MSVSRWSGLGESRVLAEQLRGVAHRADGIADLVRDAGGQPAERREPCLLDAVVEQQSCPRGRSGRAADRRCRAARSAGALRAAVDGDEGSRRPRPSPARSAATSRAGTGGAARPRRRARSPLHRRRGSAGADSLIRRMRSCSSTTTMLSRSCSHDVLRELREVGEVEVALAHERLALAQAPRERRDRERGDQDHAAEQPRLREVRGVGQPAEPQHDLLAQHAERGDRGRPSSRCAAAAGGSRPRPA